ncbi:unnamed protein product [Cunninghamella blakesleeana]
MAKPLDHCLERLHLNDDIKLRERAEFYQGECINKVPQKIFDKGPNCQLVVSIQLAYESLGKFGWNNKLAAELAICTPKAYDTTITAVKKHLNLQNNITFETLGVTFGSTTLITHANDLWQFFIQHYLSKLGPAQQVTVKEQLNQSVWKAAAFFICARAFGISIDKGKLQNTCTCNSREFNKCVKLLQSECSTKLDDFKSMTKLKRKKPINVDNDGEDGEGDEVEEGDHDNKKNKATEIKSKKRKTTTAVAPPSKSSDNNNNINNNNNSNNNNNNQVPIHSKKKTVISGIVSMIDGQDYQKSMKYANYQLWEKQIKQRLINNK